MMTATGTAPVGFPHNLILFVRRFGQWMAKGLLAMAIVLMAGLIAVATAIAGIALATVAVILRLSGSPSEERRTRYEETAENGTITLEAKKTPRGWTVE
ncbi:MAG: hypothetical protein AAGL90_02750 [Pseudomonadota bacterium]